mmetsp:Transcript_5027/g.14274  ORF Transcript_5027/g.14274 Transcript_5027/m.14274 type:complete len:344 (-) Transcript_5027:227-1258(-)
MHSLQKAFWASLVLVSIFVAVSMLSNPANDVEGLSGDQKKPALSASEPGCNDVMMLQQHTRNKRMCLVHLGKTAGSTITCTMSHAVQHSGYGNSHCDSRPKNQTTALSKQVIERVHLLPAPVNDARFDSFLITLRNPVDRIISWYFYVHPEYPPAKLPRHKAGCQNFAFFHCWPTLQAFVSQGLNQTRTTSSHTHHLNQSQEECAAWAWDAVTGTRHCWHNYFNYNRTYGPLLSARKDVFAIRSEHLWSDLTNLEVMFGGDGRLIPFEKNHFAATSKHSPQQNREMSEEGRLRLCRALCNEIQIYKKLLHMAENLCPAERAESLAELIETCPNEEKHARQCSV